MRPPLIHSPHARCPECRKPSVYWQKVDFYREEDGAFNWRLDVYCLHCGEIEDKETTALAHDDYTEHLAKYIKKTQNENFDRYLGRLAHANLCRMSEQL